MNKLWTFALLALLAACANPVVRVNTVDDRPTLGFKNAHPTATLILDGATIGPAAVYDGEHKTLLVNSGTHLIEVRDGDRLLYSSPVYLGAGEARIINLPD